MGASAGKKRARRLATLAAAAAALAFPGTASASFLWWSDDGNSFTTFGPNASITIDTGAFTPITSCPQPGGVPDGFTLNTDIYIVAPGSYSEGATLNDLSGSENAVFGASGGLFVSETIGFAKPGGNVPGGTYAVVYDECQDGKFQAAQDSVFDPAFTVNVPTANVPPADPAIAAYKSSAGQQANRAQLSLTLFSGLLEALDAYEKVQCALDPIDCFFGPDALLGYFVSAVQAGLGVGDPKELALASMANEVKHYRALEKDPPDPLFQQQTTLGPISTAQAESNDPLVVATADLNRALSQEQALAEGLLHALERYQGADAASDGDWALAQARAMKEYATALQAQLPVSSAALAAFGSALATDTRDLDGYSEDYEALRARIEADGFDEAELKRLRNAGLSNEQIVELEEDFVDEDLTGNEAALQIELSAWAAANGDAANGLAAFVAQVDGLIDALRSDPGVFELHPIANAGGPYTVAEGTPLAFDGTGSAARPGASLVEFAWDLDGDGDFDDGTTASPSYTYLSPRQQLVGLRVTDDDGSTDVSYASVTVTAANGPPVIVTTTPLLKQRSVPTGDTATFGVATSDPESDAVSIEWSVDGAPAGTGDTYTYTAPASAGTHVLRVVVRDGPFGGVAAASWSIEVEAPDADGDGWNANVDCVDSDPAIPGEFELVGNGKDDDCDSSTPDTGSAPAADFSQQVAPGLVVTFTDESTDRNDDIVEWAWDFGDGATSTAQNPTHAYAVKGTKTITLTVEDSTGNTGTVTRDVVVASAPVAAFTYAPPAPVGGSEVEFTDASTDSDGTIVSWAWTFGDGGTSAEQSPKHMYVGPGSFDVTLTVTDDDGSTGTVTQTLVLGVAAPGTAPVAAFRADVPGSDLAALANGGTVVSDSGTCCGGHEAYQMLDDNVGLPWATNGVTGKFATIQISTGTARAIDQVQIQPRSDCCVDQRVRNFAIDVSTTGFAPTDFTQVLNATTADNGNLQTFALPAGTTAKYVRYRPLTNNGSCCYLSTSKFKVISSSSGPRTVTFQNQSMNAATYTWTFGDGSAPSTAANPTHTYAVVGTYTVTLVARSIDGRTNTVTRQYEARGPTADFDVEPAVPEPGEPAIFTDSSLFALSPGATFAWNFGDGGTSTSAGTLHTFAAAGTYTVTYTATDAEGNADTVTKEVTVAEAGPTALPRARFAPSSGGVNVAFSGAGATIHSFSSQYSTAYPPSTILDEEPSNNYWATANTVRTGWVKVDLAGDVQLIDRIRIGGDGGTERVKDFKVSISDTTSDDAAFTQVLAASNPNDDTLREYVFPGGAVSARYVRVELVNNWGHTCCAAIDRLDVLTGPASSTGRNLALAADGASIAAFSGQYDATNYPPSRLIDGDPSTLPWLTPNGVTTGWVKVTLSSATPRMIDRIRIQPRQGAQKVKDFEIAVSATGTADRDFVSVLSATAVDNENLQTFVLPYPMPAKHLLYRVKTNRAGGNYTGTGDVRVDTGQESRSLTVRFSNLSRNATSYEWDFGDGSTSTDANPSHTYAAAGTYDVTLTATNANGSTTFELEQVVRAAAISYTPATPEAQQQIDFLDATPTQVGLQSWAWDFGDGTTSTFQHPVKTYAAPGSYTVTMTATDRDGGQHVATETVVVAAPSFRAVFRPRGTFNMASLENGAAVVAFSSQYDCCTWNAPKLLDAFTNTAWHSLSNPAQSSKWIKFSLAGGQTYQLDSFQLLGRQDCCHDQHPRDFELAVSTTGTADADFKTVLRATLPAGRTTLQTFQLPRPVLAKYVLYRALNTHGANVVTTAMLRAVSGQVNTPTVTFDDLTVGGAAPLSYAWDFGDGGTSTDASPTHTFPGPGTYDVTLTVTDGTGATSAFTLAQKILNAPVPSFTNSPGTPNEAQSTSFNDTTPSPADGPLVERRWSWADGTANTNLAGAATTHTFADDGVYDVRLEVQDAWGQTASVTRPITVANVAPTAEAGPSWRWREDRALAATVTVADVAGTRDPVTCTWTYGDGTAAGTGCPFSHTYANTGTYTATLTANDGDGGITTDTFTVEVIEQEVTGGGGGGGSGSAGGTGVGKTSKDYVYTVDGDFELGTLLNVNHDAPGNDQLQLNKQAKPFPFVYIANSGRGTAVRIDVDSGQIVGEYMTAPVNRSRNPSRTTVDKLGNVWVTNRDESSATLIDGVSVSAGSTTRIGLIVGGTRSNADGTPNANGEYLKAPFEYNTCVDKNGDGLIRTSRGLTNILPWPNTSGVDHDGGVETAVDECIQFYIRVRGTNTRTVAITADNDAYIGGANNWHERVDGETGQRVPGTAFDLNCGGYGGLIDGNGILWSARYGNGLLRYDTNTKTGVCLGNSHGDYGLGIDPVTGHIWHTTLNGNRVVKLNPAATTAATIEIARYFHGNNDAQGTAVDGKGNVWVAHALYGAPTIGRLRTDGVYLGAPALGPTAASANGSTGVAVDANGKVWSANYNTSNVSRIDPEIGQKIAGTVPSGWYDMVVSLGSGASPYNYSDMTGAVAIGAASPSGFWSIQQDATALGTIWKRISWDGSTPAGTSITVEARAADTQAALTSTPFITATDGGLLSGVVGRFIEVRATLQTNDPSTTPILTDIRISANTPPVASDGTAETNKDEAKNITLAATDDDGDTLTYELVDAPAHGAVSLAGNVATYTPASGYVGPDAFTFKARDGTADSNVATISLTVLETNEPPVAGDLDVTTPEDTPLPLALPATDPDGDTLTLTYGQPAHGSYDGTTYTPAPNYHGPDSFAYTATDPEGESDSGTISINVTPVNDAPFGAADGYTIDEDTTLEIPAPGILANDGDIDGDVVTAVPFIAPIAGTLTYLGGGGFRYQPGPEFFGTDTFSYRVSDGTTLSAPVLVTITVRMVDDAPVAQDASVTTAEDTPVGIPEYGDYTDVDGGLNQVTLEAGPQHGTWDGIDYTPAPNYHGPDEIRYRVTAPGGATDVGTISITVTPVNDAPVAADQSVETDEDRQLAIALGATDVDGDPLTFALASGPQHGTWNGTVYTPDPNYHGPDSFDFLVSDGNGGSDVGTISITVHPVNDAPVAADQSVATDEDTPLAITLAASDVDGDALAYALATAPQHGTWDGATYTPAANYHGPDSFDFLVSDGRGGSDVGTISIVVRPVNDAPNVEDLAVATDEDTPLAIALAGSDVDGDALAITTTAPGHGTYASGVYTPDANYHGPDSFQYTASDGNGGTDTATVSITVRPVNDAPNVGDLSVETDEDTPLPIPLAGTDVDGDSLTITTTSPGHGTYAGGVYTPAPDYHGPDSFQYTADDGNGGTDTATVSITVRPVNEAPVVRLVAPAATDEASAPVPLEAIASDPDGDATLTYSWSAGTGTVTPSGSTAGYTNDDGPRVDTVTVTVSDGSLSSSASAEIQVRNVAPTAAAGPDKTGFWGLPLVFAGTATDPSNADTAAGFIGSWSFADGTLPVAGLSVGHTYAQPGSYVATFTASDKDGGSDTDEAAVTIERRTTALGYTGPTTGTGAPQVLTARLTDTIDTPSADLAGKTIVFSIGGTTVSGVTDASGVASATATLPSQGGTLTVSFAGDARYLGSSASATIGVAGGPGKVTGGGLRAAGSNGRGGFNVQSTAEGVKGELQWQRTGLDFHAHTLLSLLVSPDSRTAWFTGVGVDGRAFTVYVEDNGEPGRNDVFMLWIGGRLESAPNGTLVGGNIQIH